MPLAAPEIARNVQLMHERIARAAERSGRSISDVTLVAVSKTFSADAIRSAHAAGLRHFGENRVQERETKSAAVAELGATWHFIGHLQSNKVRRAVDLFDRIDSIDSAALARKIDEATGAQKKTLGVLVEVHMGEASKSGVAPADLPALAEATISLPHLNLLGLLAVPPYADDPEFARPYFQTLRKLRDQTAAATGLPLPVLSMGMSHDFEIAIEEGATEVRIGTALFGARARSMA